MATDCDRATDEWQGCEQAHRLVVEALAFLPLRDVRAPPLYEVSREALAKRIPLLTSGFLESLEVGIQQSQQSKERGFIAAMWRCRQEDHMALR